MWNDPHPHHPLLTNTQKSSTGLKKTLTNKKMKFTKTYLELKKDNFDDIKEQIFKNNVSARDRTGDHLRVRQM
jgi:hypothetical protein